MLEMIRRIFKIAGRSRQKIIVDRNNIPLQEPDCLQFS